LKKEGQLRFVLRERKKDWIRQVCALLGRKIAGLEQIRIGQPNPGKLPMVCVACGVSERF
jgi:16S rRNA U516 pseudouridylate synthase RsuA-like enzyme